ncbi:hypothetical protein Peur_022156 [Populus x canadensis]
MAHLLLRWYEREFDITLNLNAVERSRGVPYLAIGKHLCGPATDRKFMSESGITREQFHAMTWFTSWAVDADHDCIHNPNNLFEHFDAPDILILFPSGVKVQEAENYMDGEPKKEEEGDIEKVDEKKETESKKMKIKEGFHVL